MEISQKLLCFLFLSSFAVGIVLGVLYDLLSVSRMLFRLAPVKRGESMGKAGRICGAVLLFVEDLCFALVIGISLLLLLYFINDGVFRWIAPAGLGCGFFVYRVTLGRLMAGLSEALVLLLHRLLRRVLCLLWMPVRACLGLGRRWLIDPLRTWLRQRHLCHEVKATERKMAVFIQRAGQLFSTDD